VNLLCRSEIEMGIGLARFPFLRDLDGFDFGAQASIDFRAPLRKTLGGRCATWTSRPARASGQHRSIGVPVPNDVKGQVPEVG
jgi:hypothetical protein